MKVWIIWIIPSGPSTGVRYIDSIWADEYHSESRKAELRESWNAAGNPVSGCRHTLIVQQGVVADAAIQSQDPQGDA